jgi:hypothetical protein
MENDINFGKFLEDLSLKRCRRTAASGLSNLQKWILLRTLEGKATVEDRAREAEEFNAALNANFGIGAPKRVKRRDVPHLTNKEVLSDYFGCKKRIVPEDDERSAFWWRNEALKALNRESLTASARVKDLSPKELEWLVDKWCPRVKAAWDRVDSDTRLLCEALLEAKNDRDRARSGDAPARGGNDAGRSRSNARAIPGRAASSGQNIHRASAAAIAQEARCPSL